MKIKLNSFVINVFSFKYILHEYAVVYVKLYNELNCYCCYCWKWLLSWLHSLTVQMIFIIHLLFIKCRTNNKKTRSLKILASVLHIDKNSVLLNHTFSFYSSLQILCAYDSNPPPPPQGHRRFLSINHISLDTCTCTCSWYVWSWRHNTTWVQVKWNCTSSPFWIYPRCPINEVSWTGGARPWKAMPSFSVCAPLMGLRSEPTGQADLWRRGTRQVSRKLVYWWATISSHQLLWTDTYTFVSLYSYSRFDFGRNQPKPGCRQIHIVISNKQKKGTWPAQHGFLLRCEVIFMTVIVKEHRYLQPVQMCSKETMVVLASAPHPISVHDYRSL